jgi:hypothetical protein
MTAPLCARAAALAALTTLAANALAEPATFKIDESASELRVVSSTFSVLVFGIPGAESEPGSFDAPLAGTIEADLGAGTVRILPSTSVAAVDETDYLPGDLATPDVPAPGSFAIVYGTSPIAGFDVFVVTRGVTVSLENDAPVAVDPIDGSFAVSTLGGVATAGTLDVDANGPIQGTVAGEPLGSNASTDPGALTGPAGDETLSIPLAYTLQSITTEGALTVVLEGEIVARRVAPACAADINADGVTDVFDFAGLTAGFGSGPGATLAQGDITGDGHVDVFDFAELAADFGCGVLPER